MIISSQRYLEEGIVETKRVTKDYVVTVSPEFEIDGVVMQVLWEWPAVIAATVAISLTIMDAILP